MVGRTKNADRIFGFEWYRYGWKIFNFNTVLWVFVFFQSLKGKTPARIGDLKISTRHCPLGTVLKTGLTGSRIPDAFKTDDYCDIGQSEIDLTSLWCGRGFEGKNGVCNDINECEDPETCKGKGLFRRVHMLVQLWEKPFKPFRLYSCRASSILRESFSLARYNLYQRAIFCHGISSK